MDAETCVLTIISDDLSVEDKAQALNTYMRFSTAVGRNMRLGVRFGQTFGMRKLFEVVEHEPGQIQTDLLRALNEIKQHNIEAKRKQNEVIDSSISILKSLKPGSAVKILQEQSERVVTFIKANRTRFVVEFPDGCQYSVPAEDFIERLDGTTAPRLSDDTRKKRELVRELAGKDATLAEDEILTMGTDMADHLLDEYTAARERISNAPVGFSNGVFGASLGPVRKINPRDRALVKRIPLLLKRMTEADDDVQDRIRQYPDDDLCRELLTV